MYRIFPLGDNALTIEYGNVISIELNREAIALARVIEERGFPGFIEAVPAYASATVFYDVAKVRKNFPDCDTAFETVRIIVTDLADNLTADQTDRSRMVKIPVHFDDESSLDIAIVADWSGLTASEVIDIFLQREYRVFMLGFLPGFSYMGEVDERIAMPRRETPRTLVPKGSVGIAGRQTGIYSLASPGGWQIIGRTEMEMFTPKETTPSPLRAGDIVRFVRA